MDDKADNPRDLDGVPQTAQPSTRLADRMEPVLPSAPATNDAHVPMFSLRPGETGRALESPEIQQQASEQQGKVEPVFERRDVAGGFMPAGVGLTPAALLEPTQERLPTAPPPQQLSPMPPVLAQPSAGSPAAAAGSPSPAKRGFLDYAKTAGKWAAIAAVAWAVITAGLIVLYRFADPPISALMAQRWLSGESVDQTFVPIDAMAPALVKTVLVSEDGRFCEHHGIDFDAIQTAIEKAGDGTPRGASTISMQVVKNLFLWPSKSYLRKALEVPLTLAIELLWPKRRIMEIYLNIAEWGPGIYGAEAAARHHFSKRALHLSDREAALLAVALPNPIARDAGQPGAGTRRLAGLIQARANRASRYQTSCVLRQTGRQQGGWQPQVRRESAP